MRSNKFQDGGLSSLVHETTLACSPFIRKKYMIHMSRAVAVTTNARRLG